MMCGEWHDEAIRSVGSAPDHLPEQTEPAPGCASLTPLWAPRPREGRNGRYSALSMKLRHYTVLIDRRGPLPPPIRTSSCGGSRISHALPL